MIAARRLADHLKMTAAGGKLRMSINEAFGRYWQERAKFHKTKDTIDYQLDNLRQGLGKLSQQGNDLSIRDIDRPLVIAYREWRRVQESKRGGLISPTSVNNEIRLLRTVLNIAREDWNGLVDLDLSFKKIFLTEPHERARALSSDEEARLIEALDDHDLTPVVRFSIITAQRQQSVMKLEWRDIDYEAATVTFRDVKSNRDGKEHQLPLTAEMRAMIAPLRADHPRFIFTYLCRKR